jgi:nitrate/nitrite-specific signal transduction histidine kinase
MQIDDDGSGINMTAPSMNGMGLRIMRYRARMIGAEIDIRHRQTGGTEVVCRYDPAKDQAIPRANHGNGNGNKNSNHR